MGASETADVAGELDDLGYGTIWVPEGPGGREVFVSSGLLLAATARLHVASAIACISWRTPFAAVAAARTLHAAHGGRFVLGHSGEDLLIEHLLGHFAGRNAQLRAGLDDVCIVNCRVAAIGGRFGVGGVNNNREGKNIAVKLFGQRRERVLGLYDGVLLADHLILGQSCGWNQR